MPDWLIPVSLFFPLVAIYLGGTAAQPVGGGGLRQVLGLILSLAVYFVAWRLVHGVLLDRGPVLGGVVLPTLIVMFALPLVTRLGFLLVGVKVMRVAGAGH